MLIEKLLNLNWGGLGHLVVHVLYNWLFSWQNKINTASLLVDNIVKILLRAMYLTSLYLGQSLTNFNPKMQDFKRVLDLNCK